MRARVIRTMLVLAFATCAALVVAPGAGAVNATPESYTALQKQIASGKVIKATVSPQKHVVKVKLSNAKTYSSTYTSSQQAALLASLKAKHAKVHVDKNKKKKSSHLRYRYIVLIALVVAALAGGLYYLLRGRRRSGGPGQPPTVIEPGPSAGRPHG